MSVDRIAAAGTAPAGDTGQAGRTDERARLAKLAAEFESLLLSNVLRDMRSAGRWTDEDSSDTLGAGAFGQTFDTELARSLSQAGGFGLSGFLLKAFDRYAATAGTTAGTPSALPPGPAAGEPAAGDVARAAVDRAMAAISARRDHRADIAGGAGTAGGPTATTAEFTTNPASADDLVRPTAKLTSAFGWRRDPLTGAARFHRGIDLKAAEGDPVAAMGAGTVVFSGPNGGYGTSVVVEHANGLQTRYAHLSAALVAVGDRVGEGESIGLAGHTGRATGPHVHYEVLEDGRAVDPLR